MTDKARQTTSANLFTVPPGGRFLESLARAILNGELPAGLGGPPDPLALPTYTVLLPTPRAARVLQDALLRIAGPDSALLLPRMRPIASGEEDAGLIAQLAGGSSFDGDLDLPPAIGELERRLVLMQLVQRWAQTVDGGREGAPRRSVRSPAQSLQLASDLARLIDAIETEDASLDSLAELVPESYSEHWQHTLDFLQIIVSWWPEYLRVGSRLSPADRRNKVILQEAERLKSAPPEGPVIVAGVTGSIPATAKLMQAVAGLDNGAVVFPGVDDQLSVADCAAIAKDHPEHPQFGLLRVLQSLDASVDKVATLARSDVAPEVLLRNRLINEALRPAATTEEWHTLPERFEQAEVRGAFRSASYLAAANSQDEAEAIALILREAIEEPGRTAALVSPDRLLARRVAIRLESWGIRVDDSAGRPFRKTVPGAFLDLVIEAIATGFEPRALMALLKHPLTRLRQPAFDLRKAARALEIAAFRTSYFGFGLDGVEAALEKAAQDIQTGQWQGRAASRLWQDDWTGARQLVADLSEVYAPLQALFDDDTNRPLSEYVEAHLAVAEAMAALPVKTAEAEEAVEPENQLWRGEAGEVGSRFFAALLEPDVPAVDIGARDYPDFYRSLVANEAVRPQIPTHPRVFIWGPLEARLQQPDTIIIGSLNDGTWPESADPGPWLNRPMRGEIGLPSPEEQIGYSAHDFSQLLGAQRVFLTRSELVDGNPTVPSRWLLRLLAVLSKLGCDDALEPSRPWLQWARQRDAGGSLEKIRRPEPRPALALRPRRLSVSAVETWIGNPYALFAGRILKLDALPMLGADPDASLRGSVVHEALGQYLAQHPSNVPKDPMGELIRIAGKIFADLRSHPRIAAFWIERFRRFAEWFGEADTDLRAGASRSFGEVVGKCVLDAPAGPFELTARADRIDIGEGSLAITDYKTGAHLSDLVSRAKSGQAPQLLLEALIAGKSGFANIDESAVSRLRYVSASGGDPPGAVSEVKLDDLAVSISEMERDLLALIERFDNEETPYSAVRRARFRYHYDDYAHLARVGEWGGEADEAGEP